MSFRGRYPSKFRRTGNFRGHERPTFRERGRPFKRKYYESDDSPYSERIEERMPSRGRGRPVQERMPSRGRGRPVQERMPSRGRGRPMEREKDYYSDRGRGRPFKKHFSDRGLRPPRSRGRYFRGGHSRGGRGRRFESEERFDRERSHERYGSPGDEHEEDEFVEDERSFHRRAHEPDEWFEGEEGDEYYEEDHTTPFERGLRSPLTIHRRFDTEEFDQSLERSPERSRSPLRRTPSIERRHFSGEPSFERLKSPIERHGSFDRRRDSAEFRRSLSTERRDSFTEFRRSSERFVEHQRSISPGERPQREEKERSIDYGRRSLERSLSPPRSYRSRERVFRSIDRDRSLSRSSRRSIERQIAYEKKRLQQILEHERKIHEKRSESSIERLLDDCKRSFENNPKSHSISRSSSFDRRDYQQRMDKRSFDRSLSPLDKSRSVRGLESITIERGRSMERSRRSLSRSPEVSFDRRSAFSNTSPSRAFRERRHFLENRGPFLGERNRDYIEQREEDILHSPNLNRTRERSSEGRSLTSSQAKRRSHFLGVGDGPFSENRSIDKDYKEVDDHSQRQRSMSPISQGGNFEGSTDVRYSTFDKGFYKSKRMKTSLELSPVSQTGSFNKREFSDYPEPRASSRMDLSPISPTGSFDKKELSQINKYDQGLSPISQNENFGKEYNDNNYKINTCETERPNSTDSMQKFLAELEDDERSMTLNEKGHLEEKIHDYKNRNVSKFQGTNKVSKEKSEDIPHKSSYYDFKLNPDATHSKNSDKPSGENKKQEELFNAYENSFLNQTYDAYNENLFQGRYEQSSKVKSKDNKTKMETQIPLTQKSTMPPLNFSDPSELNTPSVTQQISSRPPQYQNYDNKPGESLLPVKPDNRNVPNQIPQTINPFFAGSNTNPEVTPFFPNHTIGPMLPFQQLPSTLQNIPPMPFQQNVLLPNMNIPILQPPTEFIKNSLGNPTFSQHANQVSDQPPIQWKNQRAEFYNDPGRSGQTLYSTSQIQQRNFVSSFPAQSFQNVLSNHTVSQMGNQPYNTASKQSHNISNLKRSEELSQDVNLSSKNAEVGGGNKFKHWPSRSEPKQILTNTPTLYDGNSKKKPSIQRNVKEVIVISDDEGQNKKNDDLVFSSQGTIMPKVQTIEKYKSNPPTYDVLGKIFKGFVIYFGVKENSELQKDPIEVLQESFTSAEGFGRLLDVEERSEYKPSAKQVCELKWQGLLLSRGEGDSREEARQVAGIALINALAKTCYTIQTKYGYYNNGRYPRFLLKHPEKPGYYKMIKRDEIIKSVTETVKKLRAQGLAKGVDATHVNAVISFMDEFFKDMNTHCELIFGPSTGMEYTLGELQTLARHASSQGLQYRWFHGTKKVKVLGRFLCVSRYFSPQALKRYLLTEMGDTVRYRLFPPQGPRIDLLTTGNFYSPNMIKTIMPMLGPDGKLKENFDFPEDEVSHDDAKSSEEPNQSNQAKNHSSQPDSGWRSFGFNQGPSNIQSQNTNPQFPNTVVGQGYQGPSHFFNPNAHFQNTNPQNKGFNQPFQDSPPGTSNQPFQFSPPGTSNPYMQGGFKRNVPFQGGRGGKRGKWM